MSAEACHKIKALLLIAVLAGAEVHHLQSANLIAQQMLPLQSLFTNPSIQEQVATVPNHMDTMMANTKLQEEAADFAKQMNAIMGDPNFQQQANYIAKQLKEMTVDQNKQIPEQIDQMLTIPSSWEQVADQVEVLLMNPHLQPQARQAAEHMETIMENPDFQAQTNRLARQMQPVVANAVAEGSMGQWVDNFVDKLFSRAVQPIPLNNRDLQDSVLGKPAQLAVQRGTSQKSSFVASAYGLHSRSPLRPPTSKRHTTPVQASPILDSASALDVIKPAAETYANIWVPMFVEAEKMGLPEAVVHWGHPLAMGTVLCTMGVFGTFLGWNIRTGNGGMNMGALTLGETARELHPKLMLAACFFFFLGGQGGLVLNAVEGRPILESPHALSAVAGLAILAVQGALPMAFKSTPVTRSAHAYLGSATMALLFFHMADGIFLGKSF